MNYRKGEISPSVTLKILREKVNITAASEHSYHDNLMYHAFDSWLILCIEALLQASKTKYIQVVRCYYQDQPYTMAIPYIPCQYTNFKQHYSTQLHGMSLRINLEFFFNCTWFNFVTVEQRNFFTRAKHCSYKI